MLRDIIIPLFSVHRCGCNRIFGHKYTRMWHWNAFNITVPLRGIHQQHLIIILKIRSMTHLPVFRVRSWNNGMCRMSFDILMELWCLSVVSLDRPLNKKCSSWWFEMPRCSCDITVWYMDIIVLISLHFEPKCGHHSACKCPSTRWG